MLSDIRKGVTQGSILGPFLLNVFLNDLLMFIEKGEICNFADDNTQHRCGKKFNVIMNSLKHDMSIILNGLK